MSKFVFTLLLILGVVLVSVFYFVPEWERFQSIRAQISTLEAVSVEFDELLRQRDSLFDIVSRFSPADRERIEQTIPKGPEAGALLVLLERLANQDGVLLKNINVSTPSVVQSTPPPSDQPRPQGTPRPGGAGEGKIKELPFDVNIAAPYQSLKTFLGDLERSVRIIDVLSISFNAAGLLPVYDVSIRAKAYYIE
jgi:hypothetical protein